MKAVSTKKVIFKDLYFKSLCNLYNDLTNFGFVHHRDPMLFEKSDYFQMETKTKNGRDIILKFEYPYDDGFNTLEILCVTHINGKKIYVKLAFVMMIESLSDIKTIYKIVLGEDLKPDRRKKYIYLYHTPVWEMSL